MTKLKDDLDAAHDKLRKLMKDLDKKRARAKLDEDGNPGKFVEPEDELIEELVAFSAFIKANQDCLKDLDLGKPPEGDWFMADEDKNALKAETVEVIETREKKTTVIGSVNKAMSEMVQKHLEGEEAYEKRQRDQVVRE